MSTNAGAVDHGVQAAEPLDRGVDRDRLRHVAQIRGDRVRAVAEFCDQRVETIARRPTATT